MKSAKKSNKSHGVRRAFSFIFKGSAAIAVCSFLSFAAFADGGATYWWDSPEVVKTVALSTDAKNPASMLCGSDGQYLALSTAGGEITAAYNVKSLTRRNVAVSVLANTTVVPGFDPTVAYTIGGRSLRYYGKTDGKVYVAAGETETALVDLSDEESQIVVARLARPLAGTTWLNVLLASGKVLVYRLAEDGLSLAAAQPAASVDVGALEGIDAPALIEVSQDGLALYAVTAAGDNLYVVRSSEWGLVDCVHHRALAVTIGQLRLNEGNQRESCHKIIGKKGR